MSEWSATELPATEQRPDLLSLNVTLREPGLGSAQGHLRRQAAIWRLKGGHSWPTEAAHALFAQMASDQTPSDQTPSDQTPSAQDQGPSALTGLLELLRQCAVPVGQAWTVPSEGQAVIGLTRPADPLPGVPASLPDDPDATLATILAPGRPDVSLDRGSDLMLRAPAGANDLDLGSLTRTFAESCGLLLDDDLLPRVTEARQWERLERVCRLGGLGWPYESLSPEARAQAHEAYLEDERAEARAHEARFANYGSRIGLSRSPWLLTDWMAIEEGWTPVQAHSWEIGGDAARPWLVTGGHTGPWHTQPLHRDQRWTPDPWSNTDRSPHQQGETP